MAGLENQIRNLTLGTNVRYGSPHVSTIGNNIGSVNNVSSLSNHVTMSNINNYVASVNNHAATLSRQNMIHVASPNILSGRVTNRSDIRSATLDYYLY